MKKRNTIISLLTAASMLPVMPAASPAMAEYNDDWVYDSACFGSNGELQYEGILSKTSDREITLPSEINGIPVRSVDPVDFIDDWLKGNTTSRKLKVYVPEGMKIAERTLDSINRDDDRALLWPKDFVAEFILSDGQKLIYSMRDHWDMDYDHYYIEEIFRYENAEYSSEFREHDKQKFEDDWNYEIESDENGEEYIRLTRYTGQSYYVNIPEKTYDGIPVKALGTKLFGDEEQMMGFHLTIPDSVTIFEDDCFYGLHSVYIYYNSFTYMSVRDLDPETPDYLEIYSFHPDQYNFTMECFGKGIEEPEIENLFTEYIYDQYRNADDPLKRGEIIGNYPVLGVVAQNNYSCYFQYCAPLPDSIRYVRSGALTYGCPSKIHIPKNMEIFPSEFLNYSYYDLQIADEEFENVKYVPQDVLYCFRADDDEYDDDRVFALFEGKVLPEDVKFDDPFTGFSINSDDGRTYRIKMDKKDFNYYAHLIYEPYRTDDIPEEFMGFPVIDERSDALYASAAYIAVPEDMRKLSISSFIFDPGDFPQLKEKLEADKYKTFENAVKSKLLNAPLNRIRKMDVLSKDITIKESIFYNCNINEITFPGNVNIETAAFSNSRLDTLTFTGEDAVIEFGKNAFFRSKLRDISFPDKVKGLVLGDSALYGISAAEIEIPEGVTRIGTDCFANIPSLKKATINGSPEIGDSAFANCTALEDITFTGKPVFGTGDFKNCKSLKNINIDPELLMDTDILISCPNLSTINGEELFDKNGVPKKQFIKLIENSMKYSGNNVIADKYVMYRVKKMVSETVTDDMTDIQKVKALHDKLCSMVQYDTGNEDDQKNHTDISVFLNDKSVCEGYARAYNLLLHEAGIETCYVYNDSHAWNIVNIGGHYFHIDSTWDDGDVVEYTWFMKNDEEIWDDGSHNTWNIKVPSALHQFQTHETAPLCVATMGDVNSDGVVDAIDASAVLASYARASAGDAPTVDEVLGDVNYNGKVDAVDASAILVQYAANSVR